MTTIRSLLSAITVLTAGGLITMGICRADTVVLQQGTGGYSGCTAAAFWGGSGAEAAPTDALPIRGAQNQILIRFALPPDLSKQKLARARLEVFVPQVRSLRMICEIMCHEVERPWDQYARRVTPAPAAVGGWLDSVTDYHRGRPRGVVDFYSLWEYDGEWFPHRLPSLGVPQGGKWMDFDVTPLVRKWLADPSSNHGLALLPANLPDHRFPNTAEMDIPAPWHPEIAKRPRLVLEFEPLAEPYLVGMTHTLEKYCDLDTRYRFLGPFTDEYHLAMARNEFEGFQVLVYPMVEDLRGVTFEWTDLVSDAGAKIPREDITYYCEEVFPRLNENGKITDWYFHGKNFAMPDPLSAARPVDLPLHLSTPFWFNLRTRPDTPAGVYHGAITVKPQSAPPRELKLTVKVWNYTIPEQWNFQTMGQTIWSNVQAAYGELTPEMRRKYLDFLMDHHFNPTEQYTDVLSPSPDDLSYVLKRGGNTIYLSGNYTGDADFLKQRYHQIKQRGLIDMALVYIGDETSDWAEMRRRSDSIRKACPELMIMIGGSFPRKELEGVIDIFDPQINNETNSVYSVTEDQVRPLIKQAQAKGERFFWYVAAGPMLPCPNVQMEEPIIASRLLFWMTWKFGVTGFEYYCYNIWDHNLPQDGKRWPAVPFQPRGWGDTNGDGMLFYPGPDGPFSSVRFENIRDGIEDWESHYVLRDYAEALRAKVKAGPALRSQADPLLERAEAILAVPDAICKDFTHWTWDPQVLLTARQQLGDTIEEMTKLVTDQEMLTVRSARKAAELKRQREMLKKRAEAAR